MSDTVTLAVVNEGGEKGCGSESGSWGGGVGVVGHGRREKHWK